jgi:hypothetical protein
MRLAAREWPMETVKVYQYEYTDGERGHPARAKRMGTKEYIEQIGGWIVEGSEIEVEASKVDADGQTAIGFTGYSGSID